MSDSSYSRSPSRDSNDSSSPPPLSPNAQLELALVTKSSRAVLSHCLGLSSLDGVPPSAKNMIVVNFDTENWECKQSALTEIGASTFDSRDMRALAGPGMHGEDLLKQVYFYHARILENAHLLNLKWCPGDPEANRFGNTRFLTKSEAKEMLTAMFQWPVDDTDASKGFCPVVVMGHALSGDMSMLNSTLGFNAMALGTVVKVIDTQYLAKECKYDSWGGNKIGLSTLVGMCGFSYRDAHTAGNDAAMTLIAAVQMVLPSDFKPADGRHLQEVVDNIELLSQQQQWGWGSDLFCLRCGKYGHTKRNYQGKICYAKVKCDHCASSQSDKRKQAKGTHMTERCISYAMKGPEVSSIEKVANAVAALDLADF
ncbi:hypothetical protein J4E80_002144 [Alternaria sp. BMP 0032]|nr:hypothetical protein J4E80_002144 [Alternaria sp. BMP 0032]